MSDNCLRVAIHGGAGFIGSGIRTNLLGKGFSPIVIDTEKRVQRSAWISEPGTKVYVDSWPDRIDTFIYLSWSSFPYSSIGRIGLDSSNEILESIQAFTMAIEKGATRLIFASSGGTVYGKHDVERVNESHLLRPISGYGATKAAAEMYLAILASNFGVSHISLRVGNPYGPYQFVGTPIGLIARFVANALEEVPHKIIGNGNIVRDYIHIDDVSEAFVCSAINQVKSGAYNISSGCGLSINQIAELVDSVVGTKCPRLYSEERACDVPAIVLDPSLFIKEAGWQPRLNIEEGVAIMVRQFNCLKMEAPRKSRKIDHIN
jgi:UDP-glucose 4-epimerase